MKNRTFAEVEKAGIYSLSLIVVVIIGMFYMYVDEYISKPSVLGWNWPEICFNLINLVNLHICTLIWLNCHMVGGTQRAIMCQDSQIKVIFGKLKGSPRLIRSV